MFLAGMLGGVLLHAALSARSNSADPAGQGRRLSHQQFSAQAKTPAYGNVSYTRLALTLPDEYFPAIPQPTEPLRWFFPAKSAVALQEQINSWNLGNPQKAMLLETNRWTPAANGFYVAIQPELVLQLDVAARQQIYQELARSELNVGYRFPFRWPLNGLGDWFSDCKLLPDKLKIVKQLVYTNSGSWCFSDLDTLRRIFSNEEMRELLQTLYKTPTLIMRLRIAPGANVHDLVQYWGKHGRARSIQPLLESLAKIPGGTDISVGFLLPPLPRLLLYTFSNPAEAKSKPRRDCLWTSLNFFSEQVDDRFLDSGYAQQVLSRDYEPIHTEPQYGDLVALEDATGTMLHVCVYIADEVVFTKNGVGELQPWVLMKIPDLKLKYESLGKVHVAVLRHKQGG